MLNNLYKQGNYNNIISNAAGKIEFVKQAILNNYDNYFNVKEIIEIRPSFVNHYIVDLDLTNYDTDRLILIENGQFIYEYPSINDLNGLILSCRYKYYTPPNTISDYTFKLYSELKIAYNGYDLQYSGNNYINVNNCVLQQIYQAKLFDGTTINTSDIKLHGLIYEIFINPLIK